MEGLTDKTFSNETDDALSHGSCERTIAMTLWIIQKNYLIEELKKCDITPSKDTSGEGEVIIIRPPKWEKTKRPMLVPEDIQHNILTHTHGLLKQLCYPGRYFNADSNGGEDSAAIKGYASVSPIETDEKGPYIKVVIKNGGNKGTQVLKQVMSIQFQLETQHRSHGDFHR